MATTSDDISGCNGKEMDSFMEENTASLEDQTTNELTSNGLSNEHEDPVISEEIERTQYFEEGACAAPSGDQPDMFACCFKPNVEDKEESDERILVERRKNFFSRNIPVEAVVPVDKYANEYNFNHKNRGYALILNHERFDMPGYKRRKGTQNDVNRLKRTLNQLSFEVLVHDDLTYSHIKKLLESLSSEDHKDNDCFLMVVLTHGGPNGKLCARDTTYPTRDLFSQFWADSCPTLAGKPKIFFIQACRGRDFDPGVNMRQDVQLDSGGNFNNNSPEYTIPINADILVMYSSTEGYASFLTQNGSPFIQNLCKLLDKQAFEKDLATILTFVKQRVCLEYKSERKGYEDEDQKKVAPEVNSTCMRLIVFSPKSQII